MEPPPTWVDHGYIQNGCIDHTKEDDVDSFAQTYFDSDEEKSAVCINSVLPDDILERVLGRLTIATIIKAGCVCKKWNEMVHSGRFIQNLSSVSSQKPWYFMFTCDSDPYGHVYDPMLSKWYRFQIPYVESPSWNFASSSGLVCFMDNDYGNKLFVCNPVTRRCRNLEEPPGGEVSDYCALAILWNKSLLSYTVTIVKSKQAPGEQIDWDLSIIVYRSENKTWTSLVDVTLQAWRSGADSVICRGILYFVVHLTKTLGYLRPRCGVLAYDLASQSSHLDVDQHVISVPNPITSIQLTSLEEELAMVGGIEKQGMDVDQHVISAPCCVTCMRLINLREELVMVGGIEKLGRPGIIKGIGVWVLRGKEWEEVSRMPNKFFRGLGECDDVFACSGFDKLIYVHSYGSPALVMFDMNTKEWKWSHRCPAAKKFPLQLFSGICFEPRLEISP